MKRLALPKICLLALFATFFGLTLNAQQQERVIVIRKAEAPDRAFDKALIGDDKTNRFICRSTNPGNAQNCKVFIGVGTETVDGQLRVDYTLDGTPAEAMGLREGDIITAIDGVPVTTQDQLIAERNKHQPGETFTLDVKRESQVKRYEGRFNTCDLQAVGKAPNPKFETLRAGEMEEQMVEEISARKDGSHVSALPRDPCAVFIGVYSSNSSGEGGPRVTGVIEGTPAYESGIQMGDVILSMDGVRVNSYTELVAERDKHQPGDAFSLGILRNGVPMSVDAQFMQCPKDPQPVLEKIPETATAERRQDTQPAPEALNVTAFPNPTPGPVSIRFDAEPIPTTVRITDQNGRVVYNQVLNQFGGSFSDKLDLFGRAPGMFTLTVEQGGKVAVQKIVLVSRA